MKTLKGKVAVVVGATRGAGRGIARALGEAGAVVYCTGRSTAGNPSPYRRPETIEETAEMVSAAGGTGVAVRVDHTVEAEVRDLFKRVGRERGRLDVLADSTAGEDLRMAGWSPVWKTKLDDAADVLHNALLSHVVTAKYAAPLMIAKRRGLVVEVTEGDTLLCGGNVLAQLVKFSLKGFAFMLAEELRRHRVTAVALTPGYLRSESMLERFGVTEANWREGAKKDKNFLESESPLFVGRAVAALARDPKAFARTGQLTSTWELASEYGFTDADGRRPNLGAELEEIYPSSGYEEMFRRHNAWLERILRRGRLYAGEKHESDAPARGERSAAV
jgi:NAD(P)-dependent dehydrogenase (short-subunit alcohol dehydrogenase family)